MESRPAFDTLLRRARRAAGLTQEQLAERAGLSARVISDLERGVIRAPRLDTLELLAESLNLDDAQQAMWKRMRQRLSQREVRKTGTPSRTAEFASLPVPLTTLVGRRHETTEIVSIVQESQTRLLTLLGPGGIGKTRLALEVAHKFQDQGAVRATFVDLTPVRDPGSVPPAIALALGLKESADRSLYDQLTLALRNNQLLLVLDNVEHVIDAAPLLAELLRDCPRLKVLATSRIPLNIQGERRFPVGPLPLPGPAVPIESAQLLEFDGVALFVQRAQAVKPDFRLTDENARPIAEICVRLDGLPLAIELAAARVSVLSPQMILQRLDQRLQFLSGGARDLPARQRTLRDTIRWSYDLLEPQEQALFRQLAVFVGGWTLEAADAVADEGILSASGVLDGLVSLCDKGLLRPMSAVDDTSRFGMLDTIRDFAREVLGVGDESGRIKDRHADYFIALADEVSSHFDKADDVAWTDLLEREHDNLRAAITWLRERADVERGLRLVAAVCPFWLTRGHLTEGRALAEAILDLPGAGVPTAGRAKALTRFSWLTFGQNDAAESLRVSEEALSIWHDLGEMADQPETLIVLGVAAAQLGDTKLACETWRECVQLARLVGDRTCEARALNNLGAMASNEKRLDEAMELLQASLAVSKEAGLRNTMAMVLSNLGQVAIERGELELGERQYVQALRIYDRVGMALGTATSLMGLATVALLQQQPIRSTRLKAAAQAILHGIGSSIDSIYLTDHERELAALQTALGDEFLSHWDQGAALTVDEAVAEALRGTTSGGAEPPVSA